MCVKIIAKCKEDVFVGDCSNTDLYPGETRPETRKILKKWADLCKAKVGEPSRIFLISGLPLLQKLFMACIFFFIFSGKLGTFMKLHYDANLG